MDSRGAEGFIEEAGTARARRARRQRIVATNSSNNIVDVFAGRHDIRRGGYGFVPITNDRKYPLAPALKEPVLHKQPGTRSYEFMKQARGYQGSSPPQKIVTFAAESQQYDTGSNVHAEEQHIRLPNLDSMLFLDSDDTSETASVESGSTATLPSTGITVDLKKEENVDEGEWDDEASCASRRSNESSSSHSSWFSGHMSNLFAFLAAEEQSETEGREDKDSHAYKLATATMVEQAMPINESQDLPWGEELVGCLGTLPGDLPETGDVAGRGQIHKVHGGEENDHFSRHSKKIPKMTSHTDTNTPPQQQLQETHEGDSDSDLETITLASDLVGHSDSSVESQKTLTSRDSTLTNQSDDTQTTASGPIDYAQILAIDASRTKIDVSSRGLPTRLSRTDYPQKHKRLDEVIKNVKGGGGSSICTPSFDSDDSSSFGHQLGHNFVGQPLEEKSVAVEIVRETERFFRPYVNLF